MTCMKSVNYILFLTTRYNLLKLICASARSGQAHTIQEVKRV